MTKYVVFASSTISDDNAVRSLGLLDSLAKQGVLKGPITSGDIRRPENIEFLFPWDTKIENILQNDFGLEPIYTIVRAEVVDEKGLKEHIHDIKIMYGYTRHQIYDL